VEKYHSFRTKTGKGWRQIPSDKIVAWIEKNFDYKTRKDGSEYTICDPFSGDSKYKFNINPENGVCHSWHGDEWAGPVNPKTGKRNCSVVNFVKTFKKCSYRQALAELLGDTEDISQFLKSDGRINGLEKARSVTVALPDGVEILSTSQDKQASALRQWLKSRGYIEKDIEKAELYYLGMDVYWPYFEFEELVYWQSRSRLNKRFEFPPIEVFDKQGNVIGKTIGSKGDYLYGFDNVEMASYLIITEAIFDQNTLGIQCVASGGCDLTANQINKIKILGPKKGVILSPDNDNAGISSIIRNRNLLEPLQVPLFYSIPPKLPYTINGETKHTKDWNEIGEKVVGFERVRDLHDQGIKKLTLREVIKIKRLLPRGKSR